MELVSGNIGSVATGDDVAPSIDWVDPVPAAVGLVEPHNGRPGLSEGDAPARGVARPEVIEARDTLFRRALALADMLAVGAALALGSALVGHDPLKLTAVAVPIAFVVMAKAMGLYDRDEHLLHKSTLDEVPALFGIATLAVLLLWLTGDLLVEGELGQRQVLGTWAALFVLLVCLRSMARGAANRLTPVERCLLIGDPITAEYVKEKLEVTQAVKAELVGAVPPIEEAQRVGGVKLPAALGSIVTTHRVDRVILATDGARDELLYMIRELKTLGVKVSVLPEASRVAGSSVELDHLHGITLLGMRRFEFTRSSLLIKRSMDLAGSLGALLLLAPVLLVLAIAIRLDSPGPILFRQQRIGRHGKSFQMLKFRSMVDEADQLKDEIAHLNEGAAGLFKIVEDPRRTSVGRLLRKLQLDELPQLLNVVRGEMSLVGPRPLIAEEDSKIEGWYRRRLDIPPGITGHWQILGSSSRVPLAEMVKLDFLYVANWSVWGDMKLLLRTIPFLARRNGV
jgi:exopolysaccharide biosynthesis polyprenyl glycosylphosphotransferase